MKKKIGSLEKFLDLFREQDSIGKPAAEVFFEIERTTLHHKKGEIFRAEAQVKLPRKGLRVESLSENLRTAINDVKDELQVKLKRYKNKVVAQSKKKARSFKRGTRKCQS